MTTSIGPKMTMASRMSLLLAAICIAIYNFISTCTPYFEAPYTDACANSPLGSQYSFGRYRMANNNWPDYDAFIPETANPTMSQSICGSLSLSHPHSGLS